MRSPVSCDISTKTIPFVCANCAVSNKYTKNGFSGFFSLYGICAWKTRADSTLRKLPRQNVSSVYIPPHWTTGPDLGIVEPQQRTRRQQPAAPVPACTPVEGVSYGVQF